MFGKVLHKLYPTCAGGYTNSTLSSVRTGHPAYLLLDSFNGDLLCMSLDFLFSPPASPVCAIHYIVGLYECLSLIIQKLFSALPGMGWLPVWMLVRGQEAGLL
jgi:hypothetical protein